MPGTLLNIQGHANLHSEELYTRVPPRSAMEAIRELSIDTGLFPESSRLTVYPINQRRNVAYV